MFQSVVSLLQCCRPAVRETEVAKACHSKLAHHILAVKQRARDKEEGSRICPSKISPSDI